MEVKEILVPVDFSDVSEAALEFAKLVAEKFQAELHVLHVDDDPILNAPTTSDDHRQERIAQSLAAVHELFNAEDKEQLKIVPAVRNGGATTVILEYIREFKVDLVVMGAKGRSALAKMLLGSVAEDMMRRSPCPVVTVRKPDVTAETV